MAPAALESALDAAPEVRLDAPEAAPDTRLDALDTALETRFEAPGAVADDAGSAPDAEPGSAPDAIESTLDAPSVPAPADPGPSAEAGPSADIGPEAGSVLSASPELTIAEAQLAGTPPEVTTRPTWAIWASSPRTRRRSPRTCEARGSAK